MLPHIVVATHQWLQAHSATSITGREEEQSALQGLARSGQRRLTFLYGRRRVGKTRLLTHPWDWERAFFLTASTTTPEINLCVLMAEAARWSGEELRHKDRGNPKAS